MSDLTRMSGEEFECEISSAFADEITDKCIPWDDLRAELLRRFELSKRAEKKAEALAAAEKKRADGLAGCRERAQVAESERDQARAARDGTREDLARLQRTVDFTEAQYLKNHGGSWGECRFHAENKELAGKLSTARTALTLAAIPLEALRMSARGLLVPEIRKAIAEAVTAIRAALTSLPGQPAERDAPKNCQVEPSYPNHKTVTFSIRAPELTAHPASERCAIEEPHEISKCGEFLSPESRIRRALSDLLSLTEREPVLLFVKAPDAAGVRKAVEVLREAQAALGRAPAFCGQCGKRGCVCQAG